MPKQTKAKPEPVKAKPSDGSIVDDVYEYKENEFDQIRQCLGVYIGQGGLSGALHLVNEIVTNCIDELTNINSIGSTIQFYFNEYEGSFIIRDDGRGIPLDILHSVIAKKHYSTKFAREFNKYSGGQNGVGTTITAALSDHFVTTSIRDGQELSVFMDGKELKATKINKANPKDHGTCTEFTPSPKWLGAFKITMDDVEDYLRRLSYILPKGIKLKFLGKPAKKKTPEIARTYTHQGIAANVEYLSQTLEFSPVVIQIPEITVPKEDGDPEYFKMEFAFSYDRTLDDSLSESFCNYVATKEGGTHENVVQQSIAAFFVKAAKNLDPNAKYEVTTEDCRKGLIMVVNCDSSDPKFEGQHKSKVSSKTILTNGRKPIQEELGKYFDTNNGLLRKIVQYLRQISKIRQEAHKIKNVALKKPSTFLDDAELGDMFINISDRNYTGYKELIIVEGDSAISAVGAARNTKCQAIFAIRGVVPNTYGMTSEAVMAKHEVYRKLVKVLGCGIGKDFDITKLKYNAIFICTDSDVDGSQITSLLCLFFLLHLTPLILAGKIYKIVAPLYLIGDKSVKKSGFGRNYLFDKLENYAVYHKSIANAMDISMVHPVKKADIIKGTGDVTELNKNERIGFCDALIEYLPELRTLGKRAFCNLDVLEYICYFKVVSATAPDPDKAYAELLMKKFPELHYDPELQSMRGSYNGESITLIVDDIFFNMAKRMIRLIAEAPCFYVLVRGKNDPTDKWECMTVGQFLRMCDKSFQVDIIQRYKGLGESETYMIFPSMMNPKTRKIYRITMSTLEEATKAMELLHGDSNELREARRQMLREADITLQDIDN